MHSFNLEYFRKKLRINQYAEIRIISDSMSPVISPGEIVQVSPLPTNLNRFDIVLFNYLGDPYCHLYWGEIVHSDKICTKPFKSPHFSDIPVEKFNLIGIVTSKKLTCFQKSKVYFKVLWFKR